MVKAYFKLAEGQLETADQLKYFEAAELGYAFYGFLAETLLIDFINREGLKYGLYAVKSTEEEDRVYGIDFKLGLKVCQKRLTFSLNHYLLLIVAIIMRFMKNKREV